MRLRNDGVIRHWVEKWSADEIDLGPREREMIDYLANSPKWLCYGYKQ